MREKSAVLKMRQLVISKKISLERFFYLCCRLGIAASFAFAAVLDIPDAEAHLDTLGSENPELMESLTGGDWPNSWIPETQAFKSSQMAQWDNCCWDNNRWDNWDNWDDWDNWDNFDNWGDWSNGPGWGDWWN